MIAAGEKNWLFYPKQNQNKNEATLETTQVPVFQKHVGALTFISKNFKTVQWQLITKVTYNYQNEQEGTFPGCKSPVSPACHPLQNAPLHLTSHLLSAWSYPCADLHMTGAEATTAHEARCTFLLPQLTSPSHPSRQHLKVVIAPEITCNHIWNL